MPKLKLSFEHVNFSLPISRLANYVPPSEALPTKRSELLALQQRWVMWEAAGVPIRDVEALKWFAAKWVNRDAQGRTKREVEAAGGSFSYQYMGAVLNRLQQVAGGTFPVGARDVCESVMAPFVNARSEAAVKRKDAKRASEEKGTPLGMEDTPKVRLRYYNLAVAEVKRALLEAKFRAPSGKGDKSKDGNTYARRSTHFDFELDMEAAARRASDPKATPRRTKLGWYRPGSGKMRPLELDFTATSRWYSLVGSKGLANLFGPQTLMLDVRDGAGVTQYLVASQGKKGAKITFAWGVRSLDKKSEPFFKVLEKKNEDDPMWLYR